VVDQGRDSLDFVESGYGDCDVAGVGEDYLKLL